MRSVRPLLTMGNGKLGQSIHHFDLPAVSTCPGRSAVCEEVCYATQSRFRFPQVQERLRWCYRQSRRPDFAERMAQEVHRKGVLAVRIHVSGDFFSAEYAAKWLAVMRECPRAKFFFYTRSWRLPEIALVLGQMATLRCCRAWYSVDDDTGLPDRMPRRVRLAYLQVRENTPPEVVDLVFRVRGLRRRLLPLSLVCPQETPLGQAHHVNCGNCGRCWQ